MKIARARRANHEEINGLARKVRKFVTYYCYFSSVPIEKTKTLIINNCLSRQSFEEISFKDFGREPQRLSQRNSSEANFK